MDWHELQKRLNYSFEDQALLEIALTHSSFANEQKKSPDARIPHNERLEFLGDAVLQLCVSHFLYEHDEMSEGEMTQHRQRIVCESTLACVARDIDLGANLRVGHGEAQSGGTLKESILSDAVESVLAAIYLDGGYLAARRVVRELFQSYIDKALRGELIYDYKSYLYEWSHVLNVELSFNVLEQKGPAHAVHFVIGAFLDGNLYAKGEGSSKKEAEQEASRMSFERLKQEGRLC